MSELWTKWQGYVINGEYPLHRYLGGSDQSAVFLTEIPGREPAEAAIKLVPAHPTFAELLLARWQAAADLPHPNLIQLLDGGQFELGGQPFAYVVMDYADQQLAQLLEHRALTEGEAREMLLPVLDALAFLHNRNLVQGQLKPANILVVGDQIRLASDTIRPVSDTFASTNIASMYDPPEVQDGSISTAGDIWALGVTLFEALTRSAPFGLENGRAGAALPSEFSTGFREAVAWCLERRPFDRPKVAELEAMIRGGEPVAEALQDAVLAQADEEPSQGVEELEGAKSAAVEGRSESGEQSSLGDGSSQGEDGSHTAEESRAAGSSKTVEPLQVAEIVVNADSFAFTETPVSSPAPTAAPVKRSSMSAPPSASASLAAGPVSPGGAAPALPAGLVPSAGVATSSKLPTQTGELHAQFSAADELVGAARAAPQVPPGRTTSGVSSSNAAMAAGVAPSAGPTANERSTATSGRYPQPPLQPAARPSSDVHPPPSARPPAAAASASAAVGATPISVAQPTAGSAPRTSAAVDEPADTRAASIPGAAPLAGAPSMPRAAAPVARTASASGAAQGSGAGLASDVRAALAAGPASDARATSTAGAASSARAAAAAGAAPDARAAGARAAATAGAAPSVGATANPGVSPVARAGAPAGAASAARVATPGAPGGAPVPGAAPAPRSVPPAGAASSAGGASIARSEPLGGAAPTARAAPTAGGAPTMRVEPTARAAPGTRVAPTASGGAPIARSELHGGAAPIARAEPTVGGEVATSATPTANERSTATSGRYPQPPLQPGGGASIARAAPAAGPTHVAEAARTARPTPAGVRTRTVPPSAAAASAVSQQTRVAPPPPIDITTRIQREPPPIRPTAPQTAAAEAPAIAVVSKTIELKKPNLEEAPSDAVADFPDVEISKRPPYGLLVVAVCVLVVGWVVVQGLNASSQPTPVAAQPLPPPEPVVSEPTTLVRDVPKPLLVATAPNATLQPGEAAEPQSAALPAGVHQEFPDIPPRARRTIHGHVKVTVRLIVDKDGSVFAALVDNPGPSRYFERIAIDAAKKWTFPAVNTEDSRVELVQFDFSSGGTTGQAVSVQ